MDVLQEAATPQIEIESIVKAYGNRTYRAVVYQRVPLWETVLRNKRLSALVVSMAQMVKAYLKLKNH